MKKQIVFLIVVGSFLSACETDEKTYDATGSFEAVERFISAEATGKILTLNIEEGQTLKAGEVIGQIDVSNLSLEAVQIESKINAIDKKTNDPSAQIDILEAQLTAQNSNIETLQQQGNVLDMEIERFQKLVKANAVPSKQLDDITGQKSVLIKNINAAKTQSGVIEAQIKAAKRNVQIQNRAVLSEVEPNQKGLELIQKRINDGIITNQFDGMVTGKLAYDGEFTSIGKPLYKIADLRNIILRAYVSGDQLPLIKLNQQVTVLTDDGSGGFKNTNGTISWISSKAEFTPKTIQTKNERANLVYAIKVAVENDGSYKIGMYGELKL